MYQFPVETISSLCAPPGCACTSLETPALYLELLEERDFNSYIFSPIVEPSTMPRYSLYSINVCGRNKWLLICNHFLVDWMYFFISYVLSTFSVLGTIQGVKIKSLRLSLFSLSQSFSNFSMCKNHLKGLLSRFLPRSPRDSSSVGLEWNWDLLFLRSF